MHKNKHIEELATKVFAGSDTPEEKKELAALINSSEDNRRYFAQLRNIWQLTHPAFDPESIDLNKAREVVLRQIEGNRFSLGKMVSIWQKVAAVLIIPVSLLLFFQLYQSGKKPAAITMLEVTAPYGLKSRLSLPDGTEVWLNSGSRIVYPAQFSGNDREVKLEGEAFFDVEAMPGKAFHVTAGSLVVEATGTSFNIDAYPGDTISAVTLLTGSINVMIPGRGKQLVKPDQQLAYNHQTGIHELTNIEARYLCAWKDGVLAFRNEPLEEVFRRLGRTFNKEIILADKSLARQPYRATFEDESFDEILHLLQLSAPITYKRTKREQQADLVFSKERIEVFRADE